MFSVQQRKEVIEDILSKAKIKGKKSVVTNQITTYEVCLPYCSLRVSETNIPEIPVKNSTVEIAENFGDPDFEPRSWQDVSFYGIRRLYKGSFDGLTEVALQGIYAPKEDGWSFHPPAEKLLRFADSTNGRQLTQIDKKIFDVFLKYAQRQLYS